VKTTEGKATIKYNALKHGLLAREAVIMVGDGAENPEEFNSLLEDLRVQLAPEDTLEEMLVEKIAVAYWRLRRAYSYEVGLVRNELDNATDDFYNGTSIGGGKLHKTDQEIDEQIQQEKEGVKDWQKDKRQLSKMYKDGKRLEEIYDWEENWNWLQDRVSYALPVGDDGEVEWMEPQQLMQFLNNDPDWNDDRIWETLIEICDERIRGHEEQIAALKNDKQRNTLQLQVVKKLGNIPSKVELDRLLRYEGAIERQFYKALNQLERLQRLRVGDKIPAPVEVDLDVNTG